METWHSTKAALQIASNISTEKWLEHLRLNWLQDEKEVWIFDKTDIEGYKIFGLCFNGTTQSLAQSDKSCVQVNDTVKVCLLSHFLTCLEKVQCSQLTWYKRVYWSGR